MFSVATQTIHLRSVDDVEAMRKGDEPADGPITITFDSNAPDTSKCVMTVTTPNGEEHRVMFNRGGQAAQYTAKKLEEPEDVEDKPEEKFEDVPEDQRGMRDPRAFNPETFQPPIPGDVIARGEVVNTVDMGSGVRDPANPIPVTDRTRPRPNEGKPEDNPNSSAAQAVPPEHRAPTNTTSTAGPAPARNQDAPGADPTEGQPARGQPAHNTPLPDLPPDTNPVPPPPPNTNPAPPPPSPQPLLP